MTWVVKILGGLLGIGVGGLFGFAASVTIKFIGWFGLLAFGFYGESMTLTATFFAALCIGFTIMLYMAGVGFYQAILWVAKEAEKRGLTNG